MTVNFDMSGLNQKFKNAQALKREVMKPTFDFFVKTTPIKTGNARRSTALNNSEIDANYPYAGKLDDGYSKQAPKGMTAPALKELTRLINQYITRIGKK
jgi:hypothetical protein